MVDRHLLEIAVTVVKIDLHGSKPRAHLVVEPVDFVPHPEIADSVKLLEHRLAVGFHPPVIVDEPGKCLVELVN